MEDIERVTPAQIESLRGSFQAKISATNAGWMLSGSPIMLF